ncbi:MAG: LuxR C-terminal-related transcriptional regulator, partial [Anaerolineae bacterium]
LCTRADPPLPIARLRARRQLTELRADDLRFTSDEATAFLNSVMGLDLTPEDVKALESRTEGWIVGLQLAALSIQGRADRREFIAAFSGGHHYVLEYLAQEVLDHQPGPVRRFLLQTSILDQLCGPLCDALCAPERDEAGEGDGDATLAYLRRRNLFIVPLDDERRWYRYHHLFADLLGNFLRQELSPERIRELHRRASQWYEQQGALEETIKHALQAQDFERAADLIERAAVATLSRGSVTALARWLEALPDEVRRARPQLFMYQGWAAFLNGQAALAERILKDARQILRAMPSSPDRKALHGRLMALLATIATLHQDIPQALAQAQEALAHLAEDDLIWRSRATRALATAHGLSGDTNKLVRACNEARDLALAAGSMFLAADIISQVASAQFHQGRLRQAVQSYQQIIALVERPSRFPPAGLGYIGLAEVSLEWNELPAAQDHVNKGIELCQQGGIGHNLIPAYGVQALLRQALGDTPGALRAIRKAEQVHRVGGSLFMAVTLAWYQVRLQLLLGDVELAARWARGEAITPPVSFENLPTILHEVQQVALARVHLAQGQPGQVLAIYERLCAPAQAAGRMARVIEMSLLKALALQAQGQVASALASLEQCLSLAEAGGYVRLFLEGGAPVAALLSSRGLASRGVGAYADRLLAVFGAPERERAPETRSSPSASALVEPLTRRELEVLRLIGEGLSNQEIAARLFVTLSTVKKHSSNVYGKLGVRSRTQAVARAQELGLL